VATDKNSAAMPARVSRSELARREAAATRSGKASTIELLRLSEQ